MAYSNTTGYVSITDCLSAWIDKRWFREVHRKRGGYAHAGMNAHALSLFFNMNRDAWNGYIISGRRWFDEHIKKVLLVEKRLSDPEYRVTGQCDLLAILNHPWDNMVGLIDWKTSEAEQKTWKFQTAGYKHLVEINTPYKPDIRLAVRLRKHESKNCLVNAYLDHDFDLSIMLQAINVTNTLGVINYGT